MANSRISIGVTVAFIGASLALGGPALAADSAPLIPPATSPPATAVPPTPPAHKITAAAVKHTTTPHAQTQPQTQPLIPPAVLPNQPSQLGAPPAPRDPLPMETSCRWARRPPRQRRPNSR